MASFKALEPVIEASPDRQLSLSDPDARSMATSGRGSGTVGYNVQAAVDAAHHLILAHEVTNVGHDRSALPEMGAMAKAASGCERLACQHLEPLGVQPYVPKPLTSGAKAAGRFGKQDFVYLPEKDAYRCPAGETLKWRFVSEEAGLMIHRSWTSNCEACRLKPRCTPGPQRRVRRWEHEAVLDAMQDRLDRHPRAMRVRRATVEHVFGTLKAAMGATHFKTRTLPKVRTEMSLHVLAYNFKRMISLFGVAPLIHAMQA